MAPTMRSRIVALVAERKVLRSGEIMRLLNLPAGSAGPQLSWLVQRGKLARPSYGMYTLPGRTQVPESSRILSCGQVARELGLSVGGLQYHVVRGRVPHDLTPGGQRRFALAETRQSLAPYRRKP